MELKEFIQKYDEFEINEDEAGARALLLSVFEVEYIPILQKKLSVNTILEPCINVENGLVTVDRYLCHIYFQILLVLLYTTIELPEAKDKEEYNLLYTYDALQSRGILDCLVSYIREDEYEELKRVAENYIKGWLDKNNLVYQLNTMIPDMIAQVIKTFENSNDDVENGAEEN